jgi:WD40 repeat protein
MSLKTHYTYSSVLKMDFHYSTAEFLEEYAYSLEKDFHSSEDVAATWAPGQPAQKGAETYKIELGDKATVEAMAMSPDESLLAVGVGHNIHIYSLVTFGLIDILTGSIGDINNLAFQPNDQHTKSEKLLLVSESGSRTQELDSVIIFWQLERGGRDSQRTGPVGVEAAARSGSDAALRGLASELAWTTEEPASSTLAEGFQKLISDSIRQRSLSHRRVLKGTLAHFNSLPLTPDGKYLFFLTKEKNTTEGNDCWYYDSCVNIYNMSTDTLTHKLYGHTDDIMSILPSPDSKLIASVCWDGSVRIWDIESGICEHVLGPFGHQMWAGAWSPDSKHLAFTSGSGTLYVYEIGQNEQEQDPKEVARYEGIKDWIRALQWSPDGTTIAIGAGQGKLVVWNPWKREELQTWQLKFEKSHMASFFEVMDAQFVDGGRRVVFSSTEGTVEVYDFVENQKCRFARSQAGNSVERHGRIGKFCYSSKLGIIITYDGGSAVRAWNL